MRFRVAVKKKQIEVFLTKNEMRRLERLADEDYRDWGEQIAFLIEKEYTRRYPLATNRFSMDGHDSDGNETEAQTTGDTA